MKSDRINEALVQTTTIVGEMAGALMDKNDLLDRHHKENFKLCSDILVALADAHYPTPAEIYGANIARAVQDAVRCIRDQRNHIHGERDAAALLGESQTPSGECLHREVYYSDEHDNFYCKSCKKGMGQLFFSQVKPLLNAVQSWREIELDRQLKRATRPKNDSKSSVKTKPLSWNPTPASPHATASPAALTSSTTNQAANSDSSMNATSHAPNSPQNAQTRNSVLTRREIHQPHKIAPQALPHS